MPNQFEPRLPGISPGSCEVEVYGDKFDDTTGFPPKFNVKNVYWSVGSRLIVVIGEEPDEN